MLQQLDPLILKRATEWATSPIFDKDTQNEIATLLEKKDTKSLSDRFYRDLELGTGGLRGILGAGTAYMNLYNIRKATTALALHMKTQFPGQPLSVALSYDSRNFSRFFAERAVEVLAHHGIHSLLTTEMRPVPFLSFMVRKYHCHAGICITASHNPPAYNGYKVYWQDGAQLTPPHDQHMIEQYNALTDYGALAYLPLTEVEKAELLTHVGAELDEAYYEKAMRYSFHKEGREGVSLVYTPIHGTGIFVVPPVLERFGFHHVSIVESQKTPDGNFPTVKSPNPEEPSAWEHALVLAKEKRADLVFATDPDSDRIGVLARKGEDYVRLNGNQIGALLTEYVLASLQEKGELPENALMVTTIVTSDLQRDIATSHNVHSEQTLTGFKWIGDRIEAYESGRRTPYRQFICGGEESFGFLAGTFIRDKDAVLSCALFAEMCAYHRTKGHSILDVLDQLFLQHGVYHETLSTFTREGKEGAEEIKRAMANMRRHLPTSLGGFSVMEVYDYKNRTKLHLRSGKTEALELPVSDVLQLVLENGSKVSIRPSGTEPKIKIYLSVKRAANLVTREALPQIKEELALLASQIEAEFLAGLKFT